MTDSKSQSLQAVKQDINSKLEELEKQFENQQLNGSTSTNKQADVHEENPPISPERSQEDKYKLGSEEKSRQRSPLVRRHGGPPAAKRFMRNSSLGHIEGEEEVEFMRTKNGYVRTLQEITREREIHDRLTAKRKSFRQVVPVNTDTVQDVCKSINMKLSLKKYSIDQLINECIFLEPIKSKGKISVQNLMEIFAKEPFCLGQTDSENLGRYLIEDNTQESIKFRPNMEADNLLVRSRIKFIIGKIRTFNPTEEAELQKALALIMKKHGDGLYSQLMLNGDVKKSLMVYKEQIYKAFQYLDLDLTKPQSEYYFLRLYERSNDPNRFKLDDTYKLFEQYLPQTQPQQQNNDSAQSH